MRLLKAERISCPPSSASSRATLPAKTGNLKDSPVLTAIPVNQTNPVPAKLPNAEVIIESFCSNWVFISASV